MARVVLFHSALGLNDGLASFGDRLARRGHAVVTPDYYDGQTFVDPQQGVAKRDSLGREEIMRRALVVDVGRSPVVYIGISLGCRPAQWLAQNRTNSAGCILVHGAHSLEDIESEGPARGPLQIHAMCGDPWFDLDSAVSLMRCAQDVEVYLYPGEAHLFTDSTTGDFEPEATALLTDRADRFLRRIAP